MKRTIRLTEEDLRCMVHESINRLMQEDYLNEGKFSRALGAAALGAGLMFGHPTNANAQLNVKSQVRVEPQMKCSLGTGINIYKEADGYRIRLQAKRNASEEIGKGQCLSLLLGETEESAIQSLHQLMDIIDNRVHKTEVSQVDGDITLTNAAHIGLRVMQDGVEGSSLLLQSHIQKALKYFGDKETYYWTNAKVEVLDANVKGRSVLGTLPRPDYIAEGEGKVVVDIWVDNYGNVRRAIAGGQGTTVSNQALWVAAEAAAKKTHFDHSDDAPALQQGTITYIFKLK